MSEQTKKRELKIHNIIPSRPTTCFIRPKEYLLNQATKGAEKRYGTPLSTEISQRLAQELKAIENAGIINQVALLYEQKTEAEKHRVLVGNGRGSAPGSLLLFTLGITRVDPLKYGLLFERFLNPDTQSKIRIDLEVSHRGSLLRSKEDHPYTLLYDSAAIKIGMLTLSPLTLLQDRITYIESELGEKIRLGDIPTDDLATFYYFCKERRGRFNLLEVRRIQQLLKEIKPDSFGDLMVAISTLYSKGTELVATYIARKQGREPIAYHLPMMEQYLSETYGMVLYQEQIMQLAQAIANFTPGMSDNLRRALYTRQTDECAKLRDLFLSGGQEKGHDKRTLEKIWEEWVRVTPYTVNKSHIAGQALLAYQMGYLNTHYPWGYCATPHN